MKNSTTLTRLQQPTAQEHKAFDVIIDRIDWLITMDPTRRVIRNGAVAIEGTKIAAVGKSDEIYKLGRAKKQIDAKGKLVSPGLIDCHIHTTFQMARGLADNVDSQGFLFERMYPYEASLDEKDVFVSTRLCLLELLKNGVTAFIDAGNYHPQITAQVAGETGLRAVVARSTFDIHKSKFGQVPPNFIEPTEKMLVEADETIKKWNNSFSGRVRAWFQFRGLNNTSDALIVRLKGMADQYGVGVQTHACFSESTVRASLDQYGQTEIERLARLNCLGENVLLVHVGWATNKELELLKRFDVKAVAAPSSSLHNAYGNIKNGRIPELLDQGVSVGLGSDHASSGVVDILQEMFLLSCGYKEVRLDSKIMPVEKTIEMATITGARCALWEKEIGSLEVGKKADLVIFDTQSPEWQPIYNPLSNMVYSATGKSVETVIVDGKLLMENGKVLTIDELSVIQAAAERAQSILEKSNLRRYLTSSWPVI